MKHTSVYPVVVPSGPAYKGITYQQYLAAKIAGAMASHEHNQAFTVEQFSKRVVDLTNQIIAGLIQSN